MSDAEDKTGLRGHCENGDCGVPLIGDSVYDKFYKKRFCETCYEKAFRIAEDSGFGEWFEANFKENQIAYPQDFWKKVGAFQDMSKIQPFKAYK